ncbi:hypothetical protein [Polynucleobacter necessarius]|uniref:hypothetical protein n=1 Tax=Polynucleobacter necessarius TaxID=576610 RepID=UPI001E28C1BF|nr:hypothetical protein [Polynucleobacter necessarius]
MYLTPVLAVKPAQEILLACRSCWIKKPGIVLLKLGANDALRGLSIQESENNLRQMIQMSKKSGAKVLLFGMQIPPNYGQEYTQQFRDMYPKKSRVKSKLSFYPSF